MLRLTREAGLTGSDAARRSGVSRATVREMLRRFDATGKRQIAEMLLNHASLKDSYVGYAQGAAV